MSQLDPEELEELKSKLVKQKETVSEVAGRAYPHLSRVDGREVVVSNMTEIGNNPSDHVLAAWRQATDREEWVLRKVDTVTLQKTGMVSTESGIRVRDAVESFLRYIDKPMVTASDAVLQGLSQGCKDRLVGIGRGVSPEKLSTRRCGEYVALDRSEEGVWIIPPFSEQPIEPAAGATNGGPVMTGGGAAIVSDRPLTVVGGTGGSTTTTVTPQKLKGVTIAGTVPLESWTELFRCFLNPAAKLGLKSLQLGVEFNLVAQDGQPLDPDNPTVKAMKEAANQLGLRFDTN